MEDNNREIINGADPSIIWSQYMDFLYTYGKQMRAQYTKRMRENNPFTWAELDAMNKDIHDKLDKLMTWSDNVDNSIKESKNMKKNVVKINENTLRQIVAESVKKVLNEGDSFNFYKDKEDKSGELTKKILFLRSDAVQLYEFIKKGDGIWGYRVGDSEEMQQERLELAHDVVRSINRLYKSVNEADFNDAERWNKFGV